jgi:hypothetical protein
MYKIFICLLVCCACQDSTTTKQKVLNPTKPITKKPNINLENYSFLKNKIATHQIKNSTFNLIVDSLAPYWYNTPWNFYGTTEKPQQGTIACGYFVTTLVRDAGKPINRVHLAQQTASKIIQTLCNKKSIHTFNQLIQLKNYLATYPNNSLFIIGLDCHVGFVIKQQNEFYFLHSSYCQPAVVKKEKLENAIPILKSKILMIGWLE